MSKNYFAIEQGNKCWDYVNPIEVNNERFKQFTDMTYEEMRSSADLDYFVESVMESVNRFTCSVDEQTAITLVDENGIFIWSIIMGPKDDDTINYCLVDWGKDGKHYRYEK